MDLLNEFLGISDSEPPDAVAAAFGSSDPWKNVAMDYVTDTLTDVSVDPDGLPAGGRVRSGDRGHKHGQAGRCVVARRRRAVRDHH